MRHDAHTRGHSKGPGPTVESAVGAREGTRGGPPRPFTLVLGGGGARGFVHAGVLRGLEEDGWHPSAIVGVSMGAVVGATYAMRDDWYRAIADDLDTRGFPEPIGPRGDPPPVRQRVGAGLAAIRVMWSLVRGWGIGAGAVGAGNAVLRELLGDMRLEEGRVPLAVSATDLRSGRRVVIRSGPAVEAVYASSALAGIIPPFAAGGRSWPTALTRTCAPWTWREPMDRPSWWRSIRDSPTTRLPSRTVCRS